MVGLGGLRCCVVGGGGGLGWSGDGSWCWCCCSLLAALCSWWGWGGCWWWVGAAGLWGGVLWVGAREGVVEVDDLVRGSGFGFWAGGASIANEDGVHVVHVLTCLV